MVIDRKPEKQDSESVWVERIFSQHCDHHTQGLTFKQPTLPRPITKTSILQTNDSCKKLNQYWSGALFAVFSDYIEAWKKSQPATFHQCDESLMGTLLAQNLNLYPFQSTFLLVSQPNVLIYRLTRVTWVAKHLSMGMPQLLDLHLY